MKHILSKVNSINIISKFMSKEKSPQYTKSKARILKEVAVPFHDQYKTHLEENQTGPKVKYKELSTQERTQFINSYRSFLHENIDTKFKLEKKRREKSKHGLKNYLARPDVGAISSKDVLSDGRFNTEELKKRKYFQDHPEHLAGLEDFKLSEKTKLMREAKQLSQKINDTGTEAGDRVKKDPEEKGKTGRTVLIGAVALAVLGVGTAYYLNRKRAQARQPEKNTDPLQPQANDKKKSDEKNNRANQAEQIGLKTSYNVKGFSTGYMKPYNLVRENQHKEDDAKINKPKSASVQSEMEKTKKEALAVALHEEQERLRKEKIDEEEKKLKAEKLEQAERHRQAFESLSEYMKKYEARKKELDELKESLARKEAEAEAERRSRQDAEVKLAKSAKNAEEEREKSQNQLLLAGKNLFAQAGVIESLQIDFAKITSGSNSLLRENENYAGQNKTLKNELEDYKNRSKRKTAGSAVAGLAAGFLAGAALVSLTDDDPRYTVYTPNIVENGLNGHEIKVKNGKVIIENVSDQPSMTLDGKGNIVFSGDKAKYPDLMGQFEAAGYKITTVKNPALPELTDQESTGPIPEFVETTPGGASWEEEPDGSWTLYATPRIEGQIGNVLVSGAKRVARDEIEIGYFSGDLVDVNDVNKKEAVDVSVFLDEISTPGLQKIIRPLNNGTVIPDENELGLKISTAGSPHNTEIVTFDFEPRREASTRWNHDTQYKYEVSRYVDKDRFAYDIRFDDPLTGLDKHVLVKADGTKLKLDRSGSDLIEVYTPSGIKKIPSADLASLVLEDGTDPSGKNKYSHQFTAGISAVVLENGKDGIIKAVNTIASIPKDPGKNIETKLDVYTHKISVTHDTQPGLNIISPLPELKIVD